MIFEEGGHQYVAGIICYHAFLILSYLILLFLTSYHYELKDYHLDGKNNQCVDYLIHTLVKEMLPTYKGCHKRQELGMQGPDLAEKH